MTTPAPVFAAVLTHDAHDAASVFLGRTQEEANNAAIAWLLEETAAYRDDDMSDEEWTDLCFSEEWAMEEGTMRNTLA